MPSKKPTKKESPFISDRPIGEQIAHFGVLVENLTSQVQQVAEGQVQLREDFHAKHEELKTELTQRIDDTQTALRMMRTQLDKRFDAVEKKLSEHDKRFDQVDKRFEKIEHKLVEHDKRFEAIDKRFDQVDKRFDRLEEKVDGIGKKVEEHDVEMVHLKEAVAR